MRGILHHHHSEVLDPRHVGRQHQVAVLDARAAAAPVRRGSDHRHLVEQCGDRGVPHQMKQELLLLPRTVQPIVQHRVEIPGRKIESTARVRPVRIRLREEGEPLDGRAVADPLDAGGRHQRRRRTEVAGFPERQRKTDLPPAQRRIHLSQDRDTPRMLEADGHVLHAGEAERQRLLRERLIDRGDLRIRELLGEAPPHQMLGIFVHHAVEDTGARNPFEESAERVRLRSPRSPRACSPGY